MKEFDFKEFYNNLQKDFLDISKAVSYIEDEGYRTGYYDPANEFCNEELECYEDELVYKLELMKLKFDFAYEFLNLNKLYDKLNEEIKKYEGKFNELKHDSFTDSFYSPVVGILLKHLSALTSHIKIDNENEYATINLFKLLERILQGTPKILIDRNIEPSSESEVRNAVYDTLIHVFPDTIKEVHIPKISKVYKPDIGIKSLKSAIEYKFITSKQEVKTAIGGIFEDTSGYEGCRDWTTFYAVFYMTTQFMTPSQIEAEFKLSKVPSHWKPIIVFGNGKRKNNPRRKKNRNN
jgi:hypothetical protein